MSNQTPPPPISFAGMEGFTAYAGSSREFFGFDGIVKGNITHLTAGWSKGESPKGMVTVGLVATDEDCQGKKQETFVLYTGLDKNNDPLVRQFCEFLNSTGTSEEAIRSSAAGQAQGIQPLLDKILAEGRGCYFNVKTKQHKGKWQTEVDGFAKPERYLEAVKNGSHRWNRIAPGSSPAAGAPNLGGAPVNGAGAYVEGATAPSGAGDPAPGL